MQNSSLCGYFSAWICSLIPLNWICLRSWNILICEFQGEQWYGDFLVKIVRVKLFAVWTNLECICRALPAMNNIINTISNFTMSFWSRIFKSVMSGCYLSWLESTFASSFLIMLNEASMIPKLSLSQSFTLVSAFPSWSIEEMSRILSTDLIRAKM